MRALLLAAGFGSRLRPLTDNIPKCLVDINGKPLLEIWLDCLFQSQKIERVLINTHYLHEKVTEFVDKSQWRERVDFVHEENLLGTAGTLIANKKYFKGERFFVAHADNLSYFDLDSFIDFHQNRPNKIEITMLSFETDMPSNCGIIELEDDTVIGFHEKIDKPPGNLANGAVYIFEPTVLDDFITSNKNSTSDVCFDISNDILPSYLGRIQAYGKCEYHRDIGTLDGLKKGRIEYGIISNGQ